MIKKLNGYFLTKNVRHKYLIKVRSFSGAKVSCMVDHVKRTLQDDKPDHIIFYAGTNDLRTEKTALQIAKSIMDLTTSLKNNGNSVIVSGMVPRFDNLNNKATEVNSHLVLMCAERNIPFISHSEFDSSKHLNESKLHLNFNCVKDFAENVSAFLTKFDLRQQPKIDLPTSVHLNYERKSHAKETLESNLPNNDLTSPEEQLHNLRLKIPRQVRLCSFKHKLSEK